MSLDFNKLATSPLQSDRLNPEFRLVPIIKGQTKDICTFKKKSFIIQEESTGVFSFEPLWKNMDLLITKYKHIAPH